MAESLRLKDAHPITDRSDPAAVAPGLSDQSASCRSWTEQIYNGDRDAFADLYHATYDLILAEVRRFSGTDDATCLDLTHDTFLNVIRRFRPFDDINHLRNWIRAVARTTTLDLLRRRQSESRRKSALVESRPGVTSEDPESAEWETEARIAWIHEQLKALPQETQRLLSLRYRLGWTLQRIASHLGLKTGAVDGRIRRAIQALQEQAKQDMPDSQL